MGPRKEGCSFHPVKINRVQSVFEVPASAYFRVDLGLTGATFCAAAQPFSASASGVRRRPRRRRQSGLSPLCNDGEGQGFAGALERPMRGYRFDRGGTDRRLADELILGKPGAQALASKCVALGSYRCFMTRWPLCGTTTAGRSVLDTTRGYRTLR